MWHLSERRSLINRSRESWRFCRHSDNNNSNLISRINIRRGNVKFSCDNEKIEISLIQPHLNYTLVQLHQMQSLISKINNLWNFWSTDSHILISRIVLLKDTNQHSTFYHFIIGFINLLRSERKTDLKKEALDYPFIDRKGTFHESIPYSSHGNGENGETSYLTYP